MAKDWCHPSLACTRVRTWDVVVLAEVISDCFTWVDFYEVPPELGGVGKM